MNPPTPCAMVKKFFDKKYGVWAGPGFLILDKKFSGSDSGEDSGGRFMRGEGGGRFRGSGDSRGGEIQGRFRVKSLLPQKQLFSKELSRNSAIWNP